MSPIRRIRRYAGVLAALAGALLAFAAAAPAAFATTVPPGGATGAGPSPSRAVVRTVVVGGMPGWQIALIAAGAALAAATMAVLADRARAAQKRTVTAAA
jgi:hypothetical protein